MTRTGANGGSGKLVVLFDHNAFLNTSSVVPNAILNVRGLLVPDSIGRWRLQPRTNGDFTAVYPTVTIANARTLPQGRTVYIYGRALTGPATFATPTVHVMDATAAIRVLQISPTAAMFPGDSVRITLSVNDFENGFYLAGTLFQEGTNNPVTVPTTNGAIFYRLKNQ